MNRFIKTLTSSLAALTLMTAAAAADTISMDGQVASGKTAPMYAPIGGVVEQVLVEAGETVHAGDTLAVLRTVKVYAVEDGTVTGVFGEAGDSTETVAATYGAVLYVDGAVTLTVSGSLSNAYNSEEARFQTVGEKVYLQSRSTKDRVGNGIVTAIDGTSYTIRVLEGNLMNNEQVDIYRDEAHSSTMRMGKGTVARNVPTAYTGTGSIVSVAVKDGQKVKRGDVLFETLDGTFDGLVSTGSEIKATADGVIAEVTMTEGTAVTKDTVVASVYPADAIRIEATVVESDLSRVAVGDQVDVELTWSEKEWHCPGTVTAISAIAGEAAEDGSVVYTVYVSFTPDANTRYGMTAVVTTLEASAE